VIIVHKADDVIVKPGITVTLSEQGDRSVAASYDQRSFPWPVGATYPLVPASVSFGSEADREAGSRNEGRAQDPVENEQQRRRTRRQQQSREPENHRPKKRRLEDGDQVARSNKDPYGFVEVKKAKDHQTDS
jgi:hypothetical protein